MKEGFDGLAIEVDLPDDDDVIKTVEYRGVFGSVSFDQHVYPEQAANEVLSSKNREWKYEQEVRVLKANQWYELQTPVTKVIAGHRMNPALFEGLRIICEYKSILLTQTGIGDKGIDAHRVPLLSEDGILPKLR